ncbi:TonB-dependent receptor [Flagellimonas sp. HMM57]|uniref:SusC/RagA family TonB-linked outer membrane protein n=1 Tax=unclassified Flagellimonas TaxID=2644544 RepID=UPI0013D1D4B5|nr:MULTISPECIES: TonB-dependent receptor [unclassified Flagellimonas]UII75400.1 TonB-dependent receptor [Flagellimonas sp. HMM57]
MKHTYEKISAHSRWLPYPKNYFAFWAVFFLFAGTIYASPIAFSPLIPKMELQQTVMGTVTDQNNVPLPGVTILVKGTTSGTVSDIDGKYTIDTASDGVLAFSYIGFRSIEVPVRGQSVIDVTLEEDLENLDEVVIIGYGSVKKSDLTGSVSSLSDESFNTGAQVSVEQLIQGRAAGVQITQANAQPGGAFSIRIRGATSITAGNEPLFVIDGLPSQPQNAINPGDIESIEILKDASATAIYGSRGANGVVLITTKQGKAGKLRVDYETYAGFQEVENRLDLLNTQEYISFINGIRADQGQEPQFSPEDITAIGAGTDWQDAIFRSAFVQNHQFSVSGGSEQTKFYTSLNYFDQDGVVISSGIKRYTGRVNINHTGDRFNFGVNLNTSVVVSDNVPLGNGINIGAGTIGTALQFDPTLAIFDENGDYVQSPNLDLNNPVALAETIEPRSETDRTFGTFFAEYEFFKGFSAKANFGVNRRNIRSDFYAAPVTKRGQLGNGSASINHARNTSYLAELTASYDKTFGEDHSLNALAGISYQEFNFQGFNAGSQNFPTDQFGTDNLGAGDLETYTVGSSRNKNQLLSYIGRANYIYKDRYLVTATVRADGSSRFGEDNKYGYFPSVALGWKMNNESFLQNATAISNLKLRVSYGITGNQEIGNYTSLVLLGTSGDAVFDGERFTSIAPSNLANPDLRWEETAQFNVGLDFGLFNNRISGTLDYYTKETSDLLLNLPIPLTTGFGFTQENVGDTSNRGFEVLLETQNIVGDFNWTSTFNFATVRNEVTNLGELPFILQGNLRFLNDFTILREGDPLNSYWGYRTEGIFQNQEEIDASAQPGASPGDLKFVDTNEDGSIDPEDRVILGNPFPSFTLGLNNSFSYKGFTLDFFFEGVFGNELLNFTRVDSESPFSLLRNRQSFVQDRWTPDNTDSQNPSFLTSLGGRAVNDRVVEDGSYIRLRNLRIGYTFPNGSIKGIERLGIFANAQNVFTITDYSGFNPDVSSFGTSNLRLDYNAYPLARIITLGFNIGF